MNQTTSSTSVKNLDKKPNKIKRFFDRYRFSTIRREVSGMGFNITPGYVAGYIFLTALLSVLVGTILKLELMYSLVIVLMFILVAPFMFIYKYKFNYEKARFSEIVDYMQRLIYAYQKSEKIYTALKDVREVASPRIKHEIDMMLEFIDNGVAKNNLYKEAFDIIESHYKCSRLNTLHTYLIDAELNGGEGTETLALLLQDIRDWSIRTQDYMTERAAIKSKVSLSIALGFSTVIAALYMVPVTYTSQMMVTPLYQIGTAVVLILYILLYLYVSKTLGVSYLDIELDDFELYERAIKRVDRFNKKKIIKKSIVIAVLAIGSSVMVYILGYPILSVPIIGVFGFAIYQPIFTYKTDKKRIQKEVNKAFPVWIRNLVLLLQTNNVGISIQKSLLTCPRVMRPHIEKLLSEIDAKPDTDEPFMNFCNEYSLPDIKTTMSFLYYLSNFGSDEMLGQLDYIIKQNTYLTISEEKIRNSDSLSMMTVLILAPMLISIMKLMLDMYSLYEVFSGIMMNSGF